MSLDLSLRPSKESLDASLGFDVPARFVEMTLAIWREANKIGSDANALFAAMFEIPGGPECRYPTTPPELFPIATMCVDGVHYGYVIHAPEAREPDFPMGEICPMDSGGVFLLGSDTLEAFENQMSQSLWNAGQWESCSLDDKTRKAMDTIAKQFGLSPASTKRNRRYGPDGNGRAVSPRVPPGWLHIPTSDGVGVLAERSRFRSQTVPDLPTVKTDVGATLDVAKRDLADGYAASALAFLREIYWHNSSDDSAFTLINEMLIAAYESLDRILLAQVVQNRITQHRELQRGRNEPPRPLLWAGGSRPKAGDRTACGRTAAVIPAMLCESCGSGPKADDCVRCGGRPAGIPAMLCESCGWGLKVHDCVKCGGKFANTPAMLCESCGIGPKAPVCVKCGGNAETKLI